MNAIDTRRVGTVDGFEIDARIVADTDATPFEYDCYSAEQVDAWRNDDWCYVGTIVTASKNGIELGADSLWASEYGSMPGIDEFVNPLNGDGDEFVNGYGPDLIAEAIADAKRTLASLTE